MESLSGGKGTSGKLVYQERTAISADPCSQMMIGSAWTQKHLIYLAKLCGYCASSSAPKQSK
eukprot:6483857-Ditylum_brightwellii.AAC.1